MRKLLSLAASSALLLGTLGLVSATPRAAQTSVTTFSWSPSQSWSTLCTDGITEIVGAKIDEIPTRVVIDWEYQGGFRVVGDDDCWDCPGGPEPQFCHAPPEDYVTRWKVHGAAIGVALALPGTTLPGFGNCPSVSLLDLIASGALVGVVDIDDPQEGLWRAVHWDDPATWAWVYGGDADPAADSGQFILTAPADLAHFTTKGGGGPTWSLGIAHGYTYNLDWIGCTHHYVQDWDSYAINVTVTIEY